MKILSFTFLLSLFAEAVRRKGGQMVHHYLPICCKLCKAKDSVIVTFIPPVNRRLPKHLLVSIFLIDELKGQWFFNGS